MFGILCYPHTRPYSYSKLNMWSIPYVYFSYPKYQKGYNCVDLVTKRMYVSPHVVFSKGNFPSMSSSLPQHLSSCTNDNSIIPNTLNTIQNV